METCPNCGSLVFPVTFIRTMDTKNFTSEVTKSCKCWTCGCDFLKKNDGSIIIKSQNNDGNDESGEYNYKIF